MPMSSLMRIKMMIKTMTRGLASLPDTFKHLVSRELVSGLAESARFTGEAVLAQRQVS